MGSNSTVSGIIAGSDPLEYNPGNPITVFLFQAVFIISLCQIVHFPLSYIRQPRVIAEVIAGILLGPSVMGRIPGFTHTCFPTASIPNLKLVANIGIILFLFLVGIEVDVKFIKKNLTMALTVGLINMAIPFGFGCAIAYGLYHEYADTSQKFTTFMVFIAVAMCITAFPVLARILTELRLLKERVGTIVLAAGIANDVVGWMLLALSVTLANAGSGINTLYILLVTVGWGLFVLYPVRYILRRFILSRDLRMGTLSRTGVLAILLMVFVSAFFTDIIGVHAIFGAFLVGLIVPREHGFVMEISHKIEDLVHIILIPIYFALAGFNVNFAELNNGIDWGYIIALIVIALVTKIGGGFIGARIAGYYWRESLTVGILMSCKGIVEIVVLNIGLSAGIINEKLFSMLVLMTLVCTFCTTPLTQWCYPESYREKVQKFIKGEIDWDGNEIERSATKSSDTTAVLHKEFKFDKVIYNIDDSKDILALLNYSELLYGVEELSTLNVILMKELSERTADLIGASYMDQDSRQNDPTLAILKKLFEYNSVPYVGDLTYYVPQHKTVTYLETSDNANDLLILSLPGEQVDMKLVQDLHSRDMLLPHFALLLRNSDEKVSHLTLVLDKEHDRSSLMVYMAKTIVMNGEITAVNIIVEDGDEAFVDSVAAELKSKRKSGELAVTSTGGALCGLVIAPLKLDELCAYAGPLREQRLDALLL